MAGQPEQEEAEARGAPQRLRARCCVVGERLKQERSRTTKSRAYHCGAAAQLLHELVLVALAESIDGQAVQQPAAVETRAAIHAAQVDNRTEKETRGRQVHKNKRL